jgi:hypothetical protein
MLVATIYTSPSVGVPIAFGSTHYSTAIQNVGRVKSFVDALIMKRGTVSMRVALVLRSAEVQPLFRDLCFPLLEMVGQFFPPPPTVYSEEDLIYHDVRNGLRMRSPFPFPPSDLPRRLNDVLGAQKRGQEAPTGGPSGSKSFGLLACSVSPLWGRDAKPRVFYSMLQKTNKVPPGDLEPTTNHRGYKKPVKSHMRPHV